METVQEPRLILLVLQIAGAAALLIWSVRLVRTGVERAFTVQLRLLLRRSASGRLAAATTGTLAAVFLQSSTAVAILVSNFVSKGSIPTLVGLAMLLGADVGSAVVAQILLLRPSFLISLLLVAGVGLFLRGGHRPTRQVGRILIGLALIFTSLDMIRAATGPLIDSPATVAAMQYLGGDVLTSFVLGAVFAWAVHSSVAAVLLFVTLVAQGLLPVSGAAALVLGANLGGAFIAFVLTLPAPLAARQMVVANLALRGGGAALVLAALAALDLPLSWLGAQEARQVINLHLLFNVALALASLPVLGVLAALAEAVLPERKDTAADLDRPSALDDTTLARPAQALTCVAREVLRMGETVETMLRAAGPLIEQWDEPTARAIREKDKTIRNMHVDIKAFLARLNRTELNDAESRQSGDLATIAFNLEAASDAIARNFVDLAQRLHRDGVSFSQKGAEEINDFHDRVLTNAQLALNVLMTQDPEAARELVTAKERVRNVERRLQRQHLTRLREGVAESFETSGIHQETLRVLKLVNTSFSMIGYPILSQTGDLLSSRLADDAGE